MQMTKQLKIPTISGFNADRFDQNFWKSVTPDPATITTDPDTKRPMVGTIGSLGLGHCVKADLNELWRKSNGNDKIFTELIKANWKSQGTRKPHNDIRFLKAFFHFSKGQLEYFAPRNGETTLCIAKKLGEYYYEERPDDPEWHPHRLNFLVYSSSTNEQQQEFTTSLGIEKRGRPMYGRMRSFMDKNYGYGEITITIPCPIEPTPEEKKQAEDQALKARENEINSALEDYNDKIRFLMNERDEIRRKIKDLTD